MKGCGVSTRDLMSNVLVFCDCLGCRGVDDVQESFNLSL
jgi:hypothetical protein